MAFRNDRLPDQIRAARLQEGSSVRAAPLVTTAGSPQQAKVLASRWVKSNIDSPRDQSAPPWFIGRQPFSELRHASREVFDDWEARFLNKTDLGFNFAPPPPAEPKPFSDEPQEA